MRKQKYDKFFIWLGITVFGLAMLVFFSLTRYRPDFFRDIALILRANNSPF